jgi:hypothetical protein
MKTKEAPDKLYLLPNGLISYCRNTDEDVEYTRTDAVIERVIRWIDYNNRNGGCNFDGWEKDIKNYMKGE